MDDGGIAVPLESSPTESKVVAVLARPTKEHTTVAVGWLIDRNTEVTADKQ